MTDRQLQALRLIHSYLAERGTPPTYRELMARMELASTSGVARLVGLLRDQGMVTTSCRHKAIQLTPAGLAALGQPVDTASVFSAVTDMLDRADAGLLTPRGALSEIRAVLDQGATA